MVVDRVSFFASLTSPRALFFSLQGKYEEAEPLYKRSVAIDEALYGPDHPDVAVDLNNWASSFFQQVKPISKRLKACFSVPPADAVRLKEPELYA